jgi:hypothetical protein
MRCLEKDRTRRYDTANGLAMDIQRYLRNEPVVARPPSTGYLLQKLIRRHRVGFAAGAIVAVVIVAGLGISVWSLLNEREARRRAVAAEQAQIRLREEAEAARQLAADGRREAEEFVGRFLLEEFHDDLAPTTQLKTVAKLAKQAVAYYDRLPAALQNRETERNRATALARQGKALFLQGDDRWPPLIERAIAEFERLRTGGDTGEEATLGLAVALSVRGHARWYTWESGTEDMNRAVHLLRPVATASSSSARTRREFAEILNWSCVHQPRELGIAGCQEARQILAQLGALEVSDVNVASAYVDVTDSEAYLMLAIGGIDDAERLSRASSALGERILARHPGNLRAIACRAWSFEKLHQVESRRFHPAAALTLAEKLVGANDGWLALDPSDALAWYYRLLSRQEMAQALLALGRVDEAAKNMRTGIALGEDAPRKGEARWRIPRFWLDLAVIAAQRGNRSAADHALASAAQVQGVLQLEFSETGPFGRSATQEIIEQARRAVGLAFGEYAEVDRMAREALARTAALMTRADLPVGKRPEIEALHRAAGVDVALTALRLGRFADAEQAARTAASGPQGDGIWVNLETNRAFAQSLLSLAIARQGRLAEARSALAPALRVYRDLQKNRAEGVDFDRALAFCLYVQAIASADDSAGRAERRAALEEAAQLLGRLSDEAKALRDVREVRELVDAERGKQKDKT